METIIWWRAAWFLVVSVQKCDGQTKWGWGCEVTEVWWSDEMRMELWGDRSVMVRRNEDGIVRWQKCDGQTKWGWDCEVTQVWWSDEKRMGFLGDRSVKFTIRCTQKRKGRKQLARHRHRWEQSIKMILQK